MNINLNRLLRRHALSETTDSAILDVAQLHGRCQRRAVICQRLELDRRLPRRGAVRVEDGNLLPPRGFEESGDPLGKLRHVEKVTDQDEVSGRWRIEQVFTADLELHLV